MTPVSSPDFNLFPESTLDPVPIHHEIESSIILNLTNFMLLKVPLTNWQVLIFMKLNSMRNVNLDSQICDPVHIPESILTPILLPDLSNI